MAQAHYTPEQTHIVEVTEVVPETVTLTLTLDEARAISARMTNMHTDKSDDVFSDIYHALRDQGIVGFGYFKEVQVPNEAQHVVRRETPILRDKRDPLNWRHHK